MWNISWFFLSEVFVSYYFLFWFVIIIWMVYSWLRFCGRRWLSILFRMGVVIILVIWFVVRSGMSWWGSRWCWVRILGCCFLSRILELWEWFLGICCGGKGVVVGMVVSDVFFCVVEWVVWCVFFYDIVFYLLIWVVGLFWYLMYVKWCLKMGRW